MGASNRAQRQCTVRWRNRKEVCLRSPPSFFSICEDGIGKGFQENEYLRHSPLCMTLWNFFWQKKPKEGEHFLRYAADLEERRRSGGGREDVAKRRIH